MSMWIHKVHTAASTRSPLAGYQLLSLTPLGCEEQVALAIGLDTTSTLDTTPLSLMHSIWKRSHLFRL